MALRETLERIAAQHAPVTEDRTAEAVAFDAAAARLLDAMSGWLKPRLDGGLATLRRSTVVMDEEGYPVREVPALAIEAGGVEVAVFPVGVQVVAAAGRVDMALAGGDGPRFMILLDLAGREGWRAGWREARTFSSIDGPLFLSALDEIVREGKRPGRPAMPEEPAPPEPKHDGVALLRRIVGIAGAAESIPGDRERALRTIRGELEAALADPVRDALAQVLAALDGAPTDAYAIKVAGLRAADGLRALGET